jgi:hypothetical protein
MADEPEKIDLNFLARQGKQILAELAEMREQTKLVPQIVVAVSELGIAIAATRADLGIVKQDVEDIKETARLIEGRLVRLEKHAGLVKA